MGSIMNSGVNVGHYWKERICCWPQTEVLTGSAADWMLILDYSSPQKRKAMLAIAEREYTMKLQTGAEGSARLKGVGATTGGVDGAAVGCEFPVEPVELDVAAVGCVGCEVGCAVCEVGCAVGCLVVHPTAQEAEVGKGKPRF